MPDQTIVKMVREHPNIAWEVAPLLPEQGYWGEPDYLWLVSRTNKLVELSNGHIEVLPMPTPYHQKIVLYLYRALYEFIAARGLGTLLVAPLSVRLWPGKFREPDLVFNLSAHRDREEKECWNGADLVMEVISPSNPSHDLEIKRAEYAQAGIPEYWIINPECGTVLVLTLAGDQYAEHGSFMRGTIAASVLLPGFVIDVAAMFD